MATRNGSAQWDGDFEGGSGRVVVGNGTHEGPYSAKSRFEDGEEGTNPEELLAAAHAACFSMALSLILTQAGSPPESIRTSARCRLRMADGGASIAQIDLETEGRVPGIDQEAFEQHATTAKENCPVSKALAGVPEIRLQATLAS